MTDTAMTDTATTDPDPALDANGIVQKLRATFATGVTRPAAWRREQLEGLYRLFVEGEEELVEALRLDLGRPRLEAFVGDIGHAKGELRYLAKHVERWMKPTKVKVPALAAPGRAAIQPEPLGVALVIAPWNYPIQLLLEPMAAALAAGNCVVGKPSELAPACSAAIVRLVPRYVDGDAVTIVEGGVAATTALLDERWDHIFFTGSTNVGRVVAEAAAKHLTPTTLELGGKSPCYVHSSADLGVAARRIVWGKFLNAGQTCIAPDYVLVDRAVRDDLVAELKDKVHDAFGADPARSDSYGRIVNERHLGRLRGLLDAEGSGAVVTGGPAPGGVAGGDRYLAPTVVVEPDPGGPLMSEEIFGPILPVLAVDGPQGAIDFVNARPKPLALYAFSGEDEPVDAVLAGTSSGGVCVNQTLMHLLPPELPFGGVGDSGDGAYHGKAGFDRFSHHKSVLRKPTRPDLKLLYPPYSKLAEKLVSKLLR
ncbi:MAG: aldehyde dehydrogenase family protein [Acidimicrobiia bacterium]|nr:aldehyde dehydrogenase family protein [Acidimicrobiia bacterium]